MMHGQPNVKDKRVFSVWGTGRKRDWIWASSMVSGCDSVEMLLRQNRSLGRLSCCCQRATEKWSEL